MPTETAQAGTYRLVDDQDASALVPLSTRVSTPCMFRSAAPAGTGTAPLPLFCVDYAMPLDGLNRPTGGAATIAVRRYTPNTDAGEYEPVPDQAQPLARLLSAVPGIS